MKHGAVEHGKGIYARGRVHSNTVEGFFSLLKRGINGTFHHVGKGHLHRYCDEFSFRYSHRELNDGARANLIVMGAEGKRLTYNSQVQQARERRERWRNSRIPKQQKFKL